MSYDLHLVALGPGEDLIDVAAQDEDPEREETVADLARRDRVVAALLAAAPGLERSDSELGVELTDVELEVEVSVFGRTAAVSVPYDRRDARAKLERVAEMLRILREVGGYAIFDPQLGRAMDPDRDLADALTVYVAEPEAASHKPWWKVW